MINQIQTNFAVYVAGVASGVVGYYVAKIALGPQWEAVKKVAYRIWDDAKRVVKSLKFW